MRKFILKTCFLGIIPSMLHITVTMKEQEELLYRSYQEGSAEKLESFFKNWQSQLPCLEVTPFTNANDTTRNVYEAFRAFYKPGNIQSIGGSEFGNNIYTQAKYLVVQNSIQYGFIGEDLETLIEKATPVSVDEFTTGERSRLLQIRSRYYDISRIEFGNLFSPVLYRKIPDFRPAVDAASMKAVYLNKTYEGILSQFLGNEQKKNTDLMSPALSSGESENRKRFLGNFISIRNNHWGDGWILHSHPLVRQIIFDRNMKYAILQYRMQYEGGEALLKNNGNHWELVQAKRTWIE